MTRPGLQGVKKKAPETADSSPSPWKHVDEDSIRSIGVIVAPHGLQGTVKVEPLSDYPERFRQLKEVLLKRRDGEVRSVRIKNTRAGNRIVLLTFLEYSRREQAETLIGYDVCVDIKDSRKLPADVYYITDLIGYKGVDEEGRLIGILKRIHRGGAQDILEFDCDGTDLLVPFVQVWIGEVNQSAETIEVLNWRSLREDRLNDQRPEE